MKYASRHAPPVVLLVGLHALLPAIRWGLLRGQSLRTGDFTGFVIGAGTAAGRTRAASDGRSPLRHPLRQMRQRLFHLVHQHQAQVAGLQAVQGHVDGLEFALDLFDMAGAGGAGQALAQQGHHFAVGTATPASVAVQHHVVKGLAQDGGLFGDVFVAPVTGAAVPWSSVAPVTGASKRSRANSRPSTWPWTACNPATCAWCWWTRWKRRWRIWRRGWRRGERPSDAARVLPAAVPAPITKPVKSPVRSDCPLSKPQRIAGRSACSPTRSTTGGA